MNASDDFKKFTNTSLDVLSKHLDSNNTPVEAEEESITAIDYTSLQSSYVDLESSIVHEDDDDFAEEDFEIDQVEITQSRATQTIILLLIQDHLQF